MNASVMPVISIPALLTTTSKRVAAGRKPMPTLALADAVQRGLGLTLGLVGRHAVFTVPNTALRAPRARNRLALSLARLVARRAGKRLALAAPQPPTTLSPQSAVAAASLTGRPSQAAHAAGSAPRAASRPGAGGNWR